MENITITHLEDTIYGRNSRDLRQTALKNSREGAYAALETFYHSFNQRSLQVLERVWTPNDLIQLNNPLGGIERGYKPIKDLYQRIFEGSAKVWVEFYDIVEYFDNNTAIFAGRERGEFELGDITIPLDIRTTRIFHYLGSDLGWRQTHHHGSIDEPNLLQQYQNAVKGN
ncbi:MAG: DUF4440 domain-containing protein [Moorea sp. SIOASIH]|uniref:YybH family protein n=1 Tax=Moorena sp. SIOASIH TaxID=2607817 RepID=UPI0013B913D4|nr:nuclear transport factor 2 family protein [Moorena sp. SIOASIH]NEO41278.1 DUF4440 domain-containing protein [Moorena sp. SIOASIH]